jgi:hypothetical protein
MNHLFYKTSDYLISTYENMKLHNNIQAIETLW